MSLFIKIRNFDEYKGKNPFKLFLREIALRMWDYQDCRCENACFLNKKRTEINKISFWKYLIMSLFYKSEGEE
jgi:hypothetical protein